MKDVNHYENLDCVIQESSTTNQPLADYHPVLEVKAKSASCCQLVCCQIKQKLSPLKYEMLLDSLILTESDVHLKYLKYIYTYL